MATSRATAQSPGGPRRATTAKRRGTSHTTAPRCRLPHAVRLPHMEGAAHALRLLTQFGVQRSSLPDPSLPRVPRSPLWQGGPLLYELPGAGGALMPSLWEGRPPVTRLPWQHRVEGDPALPLVPTRWQVQQNQLPVLACSLIKDQEFYPAVLPTCDDTTTRHKPTTASTPVKQITHL
jgi:hypothetical protein